MATFNYEIIINAPIQKVWDLLWGEETYGEWTQFFSAGSQFKTDWEVGGETYFMDSEGNGMFSTIRSVNEPEEVIFSHLGMVRNGEVDTATINQLEWSGAEEKYFLREIGPNTMELRAEVHATGEMEGMMNRGFNEGFKVLKNLAEK